jgi:hypothetical protein
MAAPDPLRLSMRATRQSSGTSMSHVPPVMVLIVLAIGIASASPASARQKAKHVSPRAASVYYSKARHVSPRAASVYYPEDPACLGGYLAQTQAQDYLRDDIWVLQPVPGGRNTPYRFHCHKHVWLR